MSEALVAYAVHGSVFRETRRRSVNRIRYKDNGRHPVTRAHLLTRLDYSGFVPKNTEILSLQCFMQGHPIYSPLRNSMSLTPYRNWRYHGDNSTRDGAKLATLRSSNPSPPLYSGYVSVYASNTSSVCEGGLVQCCGIEWTSCKKCLYF